jgi:hypothetical protein
MTIRNRVSCADVRRTLAAAAACAALFLAADEVKAAPLASADFSTYSNGNLVGQNGWEQYQTQTTLPLQVAGGQVSWPGGATVNNQDAFLPFPEQVIQPVSGTTVLNWDMIVNVTAPSASNPSYFAALNTLTTSTTSGNFQNARLAAQASGAGYVFGARVNGQSGYPFAFGTDVLNIDEDYALRAEIHMVAGNANDFINLYVGPDFNNLTFYATAGYTTGTVNDPLFGAILLSQFGTGSVIEAGVSISSTSISVVPEPTTIGLAGIGIAAAGLGLRRRLRKGA